MNTSAMWVIRLKVSHLVIFLLVDFRCIYTICRCFVTWLYMQWFTIYCHQPRSQREISHCRLAVISVSKNYCLLTYLLTPWSRFLPEKLTGSQLVKKFQTFLWNPKVRYCIPTCPPPVPILSQLDPVRVHTSWRTILILSSHLRLGLPNGLFPSGLPHQNLVHTSPFLHTCHMSRPSHSSRFYHANNIGWGVQRIKLLIM